MASYRRMFHFEIRHFPHLTRSINQTREQVDAIVRPWVAGESVILDDRRWSSERARLTIYEGPELTADQMGLGRSWGNVTRAGTDVTKQWLDEAERQAVLAPQGAVSPKTSVTQLEQEILVRCAVAPLAVVNVLELVNAQHPGWRVSDRVALAERSIWELLHVERVAMVRAAGEALEPVGKEAWESVLLTWSTWTPAEPMAGVLLELAPPS
jgi:hypothetical protein